MSYFIDQQRKKAGRCLDRYRLKNKSFTLFSDDCWGGEVYKHFDHPFNTPFIGLMLEAPCYMRLVSEPKHYLAQPLVFQKHSFYQGIDALRARWHHYFPIATLGSDVEIQFLHYHSDAEAQEKWTRRVQRINWGNIFLKFDGSKAGATPELTQQFDQLPFPRLTLLREPQPEIQSALVVPRYVNDGMLQFERARPHFDLLGWLNRGAMHGSSLVRFYNQVFFPSSS
ncbi:DUF1919 domain-containing protein [Hymenobacter algoricola]|uniref:DUF1919 domain-containing protein n=1 Tax=Hymenobacter algoricola TaxID=486267 RepID=A0ABP7NPC5_9BACT